VEVRDGILRHSKGRGSVLLTGTGEKALTLEAEIVRIADIVAYTNHDLQDAIAAGLIKASEVPRELIATLGKSHSRRINTMVTDIVVETAKLNRNALAMSRELLDATEKLKGWLFERVYENEEVQREFRKSRHIIHELYRYLVKNPDELGRLIEKKEFKYDIEIEARDFIAGMSDSYALHIFEELFVPRPWAY